MSISKNFIPKFVCVLTNERYKTFQTEFLFCPLGHAPGVGLWGTRGTPRGGGTLIFSHIRRLGPFFLVQNSEFRYFFGFSEK